ncbi:hypothetical protein EON81_07340 [bacterium]|nr:MAG: hypothetical protein EON81_07340 [bacterium]
MADSTVRTGRISDADLYYLLGEMYSHQSSSSQPGYVRMRAATGLIGVRHYGPGQKEKIVLASLKMLKSKDRLEQRAALELAMVHKDSRAHPLIFPLTQSPHQKTRDRAKAFLLQQGYELDLLD